MISSLQICNNIVILSERVTKGWCQSFNTAFYRVANLCRVSNLGRDSRKNTTGNSETTVYQRWIVKLLSYRTQRDQSNGPFRSWNLWIRKCVGFLENLGGQPVMLLLHEPWPARATTSWKRRLHHTTDNRPCTQANGSCIISIFSCMRTLKLLPQTGILPFQGPSPLREPKGQYCPCDPSTS